MPLNVNRLEGNWQPTSPLVESEVGNFHIPEQHEYAPVDPTRVPKSMGHSVLSSLSIESLIDDRNL